MAFVSILASCFKGFWIVVAVRYEGVVVVIIAVRFLTKLVVSKSTITFVNIAIVGIVVGIEKPIISSVCWISSECYLLGIGPFL